MTSLPHQLVPESSHDGATAARVEELYKSHVELVRSVCRALLRDRVEAEDAVQQTFLSAQSALLNGSLPRDAAAWLATIARHESVARVKARMRDPLPVDTEAEAGGPDAYAVAVARQEVGELRNALAELPAQQRDAMLMRELRGLSYEEVASELLITPTAVRSLLFRARQRLQVRLREALVSFSPAHAFRDLLTRTGGGVAAPAAAKALAVGVGAAVITGGALVGPRLTRFGHAPSPHLAANSAHGGTRPRVNVTSGRSGPLFAVSHRAAPKPRPARTQGGRHDGAFTASGASASEGQGDSVSTSGSDSGSGAHDGSGSDSGSTEPTSSGSGDTSTTSDGGRSGANDGSQSSDGGTQTTSSGSGETSTTPDGGGSGSSDGSSGGSGDGQPPGSSTGG